MRTRATTTLAAVLLLALTGCSSSDDSSTDAKPAPANSAAPSSKPSAEPATGDTAALETAVKAYTDAYFAADTDTAYGMLSQRCRKEINEIMYAAQLKQAKTDYGPDHPATDVQVEVSGDLARVTYGVKGLPMLDQKSQPWAREDGAWKYDAC